MNRDRRKQLKALSGRIEDIREEMEVIRDEEQEAYDNLPESIQDGERGQKQQSGIGAIDEAIGGLDEAIGGIELATD